MGNHHNVVIGQIGAGGFGGHRRAQIRAAGRFRLAACHDRNLETLRQACAEEGAIARADGVIVTQAWAGDRGLGYYSPASPADLATSCSSLRPGRHIGSGRWRRPHRIEDSAGPTYWLALWFGWARMVNQSRSDDRTRCC